MVSDSSIPIFFLTEEMKSQFVKTRDLLDSILETFEILEDEKLMKEIESSKNDFNEGKTISLNQFIEELEDD